MIKIPIIFVYNRITEEEIAELRRNVEDILTNINAVDKQGNIGVYFSLLL